MLEQVREEFAKIPGKVLLGYEWHTLDVGYTEYAYAVYDTPAGVVSEFEAMLAADALERRGQR